MLDQARLWAGDACRPPGLAEVLARETSDDEIASRKTFERRDVCMDLRVCETCAEYRSGGVIYLAEKGWTMPCVLKASLDPSDSRKEPDDVEAGRLRFGGHGRKSSR
jgi:hypothetical protein